MQFRIFNETTLNYCGEAELVAESLESKRPFISCHVSLIDETALSPTFGERKRLELGTQKFSLRSDGSWKLVNASSYRLAGADQSVEQHLQALSAPFKDSLITRPAISIADLLLAKKLENIPPNPQLTLYDPARRYVVFDVETTGLSSSTDRVVQLALLEIAQDLRGVGDTKLSLHGMESKINPERDIPQETTRIHGISTADVLSSPRFSELADKIIEFIGDAVIVGHNVKFDLAFLGAELVRAGKAPLNNDSFCTLEMSRRVLPDRGYKGPFKLVALRKLLKIETGTAHDAMADCKATAILFTTLIAMSEPKKAGPDRSNLYVAIGAGMLLLYFLWIILNR